MNVLLGLAPSNHGTTVDGLTTLLEQIPGSSLLGGRLSVSAHCRSPSSWSALPSRALFAGGDMSPRTALA